VAVDSREADVHRNLGSVGAKFDRGTRSVGGKTVRILDGSKDAQRSSTPFHGDRSANLKARVICSDAANLAPPLIQMKPHLQ
jgi:hypothetical protein